MDVQRRTLLNRNTHRILSLASAALTLAGVALALTAARPAAAADTYTITDLGTVPGYSDYYEWQQAINNLGHIAAYANNSDNPNAFEGDISGLWEGPGKVLPLPGLPASTDTIVFGLNDLDQCVGISNDPSGVDHAVLWNKGVVQALGELPGDVGSAALYLNNYGVVVGFSGSPGGTVLHAVVWVDGLILYLPPLNPADTYSQCMSINDRNEVVGYAGTDANHFHGVLWANGKATDLGGLGGAISFPYAINATGLIVGQVQTSATNFDSFVPVLWKNGAVINLGNYGSDAYGVALSINKSGQIVGASGPSVFDTFTTHALLWEQGAVINLQDQIPANSGWVLLAATGINDKGQIAGFGLYNNEVHDFILTPTK
jgi:probable HAF family extracellular repeat protein